MQRRTFLSLASGLAVTTATRASRPLYWEQTGQLPPTHSIVPVVGDGTWIWNEPPKDETGYLQPRSFDVSIGMEIMGRGDAVQIAATTPVPGEFPEQKIDAVEIKTEGCSARVKQLAEGASQLEIIAPEIAKGQVIRAVAQFKMTLKKQYLGHTQERFPSRQAPPAEIRKSYLQDSPGIQVNDAKVKKLALEIIGSEQHPWEQAASVARWIRNEIKPQLGIYTNVLTALDKRRGDCEEMAAVFVALCRAVNIPARLVWVPNHNWAEFYLQDEKGTGHWIPVHTACYHWFGWSGVHELVLQKGDRISHPQDRKTVRLLEDWMRWSGARPASRFVGIMEPVASSGSSDVGPGARQKAETGEWKLSGTHVANRYHRNG